MITEVARFGPGATGAEDLEWLLTLPEGPCRDAAAKGLIWKYAMEQPEECPKFIEQIGDSGLREKEAAQSKQRIEAWKRGKNLDGN